MSERQYKTPEDKRAYQRWYYNNVIKADPKKYAEAQQYNKEYRKHMTVEQKLKASETHRRYYETMDPKRKKEVLARASARYWRQKAEREDR